MTQKKDILTITRGNDITVRVRVLRHVAEGGSTGEQVIDLASSTGIRACLLWSGVRRKVMPFTIDGNRLLLDIGSDTPSCSYGLEVSGRDGDGNAWRSALMPGEFLDIVESTSLSTGASGLYDIDMVAAPSTLTTETLSRINAAIDNANNAARLARQSVSGVTFVDNTDITATVPTEAGRLAMWEGSLYMAVDDGGTLSWQLTTPERGRIYVDGDTAQSYVAGSGGQLVRLDKENADVEYDIMET